jgi:hypothetical protein
MVRSARGHCFGTTMRLCKPDGTRTRIFLPFDSSLEAEQTTMTSKPQTNFPGSPAQLPFASSGWSCLRSSLKSSFDYHVGLGLVLAVASGSVKPAPLSHVVGKPHSNRTAWYRAICSQNVFSTYPARFLSPYLQTFPISLDSMLMPAFV